MILQMNDILASLKKWSFENFTYFDIFGAYGPISGIMDQFCGIFKSFV